MGRGRADSNVRIIVIGRRGSGSIQRTSIPSIMALDGQGENRAMGLHLRYYRSDWEKLPLCKGWLTEAPNAQGGLCTQCKVIIRPHLTDIRRHAKSAKHQKVMKTLNGTSSAKIAIESMPNLSRNRCLKWWEDLPECMGWLGQTRNGLNAICRVCKIVLEPNLDQLKIHGNTKRHLENAEHIQRQQEEEERNASIVQPWMKTVVKKGELEWKIALFSAVHTQFQGTDEICSILNSSFTDQVFLMSGEQCRTLAECVIAPHMKSALKQSLVDVPYVLVLDDSRHVSLSGQLAVLIRYCSADYNEIVNTYLGCVSVKDVNGLASGVLKLLRDWDLSQHQLFGIVSDGLSELEDHHEEFLSIIRQECPDVVHWRCSFSTLAQAIDKSVKRNFPREIGYLLREIWNWFAKDYERQLAHADLIDKLGFWSVHMVTEDEEDDEILHEMLHNIMVQPATLVYVSTVQPLFLEISRFKKLFRTNVSQNSKIALQAEEFFLSLAALVLDEKHQDKTLQELFEVDVHEVGNSVDNDKMELGHQFDEHVAKFKISPRNALQIRTRCANFVRDLFVGMQLILKDAIPVITVLDHFIMPNFLNRPLLRDHLVSPFFSQDETILDQLEEKDKLLKMLSWKNTTNTAAFWFEVHMFGDGSEKHPLSLLSAGVIRMLTVPLFCCQIDQIFAQLHAFRRKCHHSKPQLVETIDRGVIRPGDLGVAIWEEMPGVGGRSTSEQAINPSTSPWFRNMTRGWLGTS
ncbi:hypothetical protein TCAL_15266 [Tigriopus californicus]|uniref:DUF4371 domain-containing protein n=1 Tax=Tigriopus californicus TaxID=6832 RepID=A0A553NFC7_TIGCA|nr:hypothetical protein TCAL_15266 [Tigriopus californicus]